MSEKFRIVNCPTCQATVEWKETSKYRPFCSKRCRLIDFGEWAAEKHSIAGDPVYPETAEDDMPDHLQ